MRGAGGRRKYKKMGKRKREQGRKVDASRGERGKGERAKEERRKWRGRKGERGKGGVNRDG